MFGTKAIVKIKDDKGKVVASQEYNKIVFEGTALNDKGKVVGQEDAETLLGAAIQWFQTNVGEEGNGVIELLACATTALDLDRRGPIRAALVAGLLGPEKAIAKSIKDIMAMRAQAGRPITVEEARARVMAIMGD